MTTTERMMIAAFFAILMALGSWLMATVSVNSGRISVLEARTANHVKEMDALKLELKEHRDHTERQNTH